MSLTANIDPTENAFTGNPVYLSVETTSMATYNIMYFVNFEFMRSIFTGNGNGSFKVNIAEVLETLFVDIPPLTDSSEMLISLSDKRYNKAVVTITLQNEEEETATLVVTAWRGGISKRAFKKLHEEGNNIFSLKFLNESCNFFFTTRSNDWRITMRETELYPLCFIYPEHELKITELLTGQSLAVPGTAGKDVYKRQEYASQEAKIKTLVAAINDENLSNYTRKQRLAELKELIPDYNAELNEEGRLINNKTARAAIPESPERLSLLGAASSCRRMASFREEHRCLCGTCLLYTSYPALM